MGFFGIDSKSSSSQTTTTAGERAQIGGAGGAQAGEGSLAIGQSGKYLESGSLDLSGTAGAKVGSTDISGQTVTITTADPELLQSALNAVTDLSLQGTSAFSSFAKATHEQQAQDLATLLAAAGQLSQDTDKETRDKRLVLYVVLGVLALLAFIFFPWGGKR
jgi:hypothetical protein